MKKFKESLLGFPIDIKIGDKVHYCTFGFKENGIVKELTKMKSSVFVVYKCGDDWKNYKNYTGQLTKIKDLSTGWV